MSFSDAEARLAVQEARLIAQIADGNIKGPTQELCRRYVRSLYRFGVQMLGDQGLAEEMVRESFQRLWRSADRYDARRERPGAFLFAIARSAVIDARDRQSSGPLPDIDLILDSLAVREALGKLSSPHAEILRLALEEGLTQSEVAQRLEMPLDTVKTLTFHGLQALRSALGERGSDAAEGQVDLAHREAADWLLGTMKPAESEEFQHHLAGCGHCRTAVAEFGRLRRILQHLPPAAQTPPDLEARTVAGVLATAGDNQAETLVYQLPAASAEPRSPGPATRIPLAPPELASRYRVSPDAPKVGPAEVGPAEVGPAEVGPAEVDRAGRWRPRAGRYAIRGVVVAAIAAALVFLPGLSASSSAQPPASVSPAAGASVVIGLHATSGTAASGQATARHMSGGWVIQLRVRGLKRLSQGEFYECWFAAAGNKSNIPS